MKAPAQMSKTAILVEGALIIALAYVLSMIPVLQLPWGGSITAFSTLPIIVMSLRHSTAWGMGTAVVYGVLQMFQGMGSVLAAKYLWAMILCALLDYILAYACLGFTGPLSRRFKNSTAGLAAGIAATGLMRLLWSFLSGILIWGAWAPEGTPVWVYSLTYNASWCLPDVTATLVAALLLSRVKALHLLPEAKIA